MAINTTNIIAATGVIQAIICSIIFIVGVVALIMGGWKALKEFFVASKKMNLFIDKMMPGILEHLSSSQRIPRDSLSKWTAIISDGRNFKSSSHQKESPNNKVQIFPNHLPECVQAGIQKENI